MNRSRTNDGLERHETRNRTAGNLRARFRIINEIGFDYGGAIRNDVSRHGLIYKVTVIAGRGLRGTFHIQNERRRKGLKLP